MLTRSRRLTTARGFAETVRGGRRAGSATVVLHLRAPAAAGSDTADPPRAGFVVGKAVGNAVTRNRVRRRLREIVRARWSLLPEGSSLVVRALPASAPATYAGLSVDVDAALERVLARSRRADPAVAGARAGGANEADTGRRGGVPL